jgi:hypothetical protein
MITRQYQIFEMRHWEKMLILHLSKYGSAFPSILDRYSILKETTTSISRVEEYAPNLKMGTKRSFEMLVLTYKTAWCHIPEDNDVKNCRLH